ncbi:MAG: zinc-ribbon domain-containing protein [Lachnospiraceae bacterium]|nr:zinc-ribbon domain-containing protein [Lachnospiraceae bacterium]
MFCPNCGSENREGSKFCRFCGAPFKPSMREASAFMVKEGKNPGLKNLVPLLLGILVCLYAVSQIALSIAGVTSKGTVTGYEQRRYIGLIRNSVDPTRYEMYYEFTAANGKKYTGSVTENFKNGIIASSEGTPNTVVVRYLPFMPHINTKEDQQNILFGFLMFGVAVLLFLPVLKKKRGQSPKL